MLTESDITRIKEYHTFSEYASVIRMANESQEFQEGDVLVSYHRSIDGDTDTIRIISTSCPIPKKFQVVHIDSTGRRWVKQIKANGKFHAEINCLVFYHAVYRFEIDPDRIKAMLFDIEYDPRRDYKILRGKDD